MCAWYLLNSHASLYFSWFGNIYFPEAIGIHTDIITNSNTKQSLSLNTDWRKTSNNQFVFLKAKVQYFFHCSKIVPSRLDEPFVYSLTISLPRKTQKQTQLSTAYMPIHRHPLDYFWTATALIKWTKPFSQVCNNTILNSPQLS